MNNPPAGTFEVEVERNTLQRWSNTIGLANRVSEARVVLSFVVLWQLWELASAEPAATVQGQYLNFWGTGFANPLLWGPGILYIFTGLLDTADGLIARLSNSVSSYGQFLDPFSDKVYFYTVMVWVYVFFHQAAPLAAVSWYLCLVPMIVFDCISTVKHWRNFRSGVKKKKVDEKKGAKVAGKLKFWFQAFAAGSYIATLCPEVAAVGFLQEASNGLLGFFKWTHPHEYLFLAAGLALSCFSMWQRTRESKKNSSTEKPKAVFTRTLSKQVDPV